MSYTTLKFRLISYTQEWKILKKTTIAQYDNTKVSYSVTYTP